MKKVSIDNMMSLKYVNLSVFAVCVVFLYVMDLAEEQETLESISSEAFSASSEILSEETDALLACPSGDCGDINVTPVKQGSVLFIL